jgi:hypothetical protein
MVDIKHPPHAITSRDGWSSSVRHREAAARQQRGGIPVWIAEVMKATNEIETGGARLLEPRSWQKNVGQKGDKTSNQKLLSSFCPNFSAKWSEVLPHSLHRDAVPVF